MLNRYQAPQSRIFIWVFWHFLFLFPVFLCLFVIGSSRCPGGTLSVKSTFVCSDISQARIWSQQFRSLQALLLSVLYMVSKISGFWATAIEVYCYKLFAVNATLEVANIYDLITRLKLVGLSIIRDFFLERKGMISKNCISGSFQIYMSLQTSALTAGKWVWECLIV